MPLVGCEDVGKCAVIKPPDGEVLSPWVRIELLSGGKTITVGNQSSPPDNTAVIKSFEFGFSDGHECRIAIHDQKGSNFTIFMENLLKDLACAAAQASMSVEFGWVNSVCQSGGIPLESCTYYMTPIEVETNFDGGKFMYTITALDTGHTMISNSGQVEEIKGEDGNNSMFLTDAIRTLLTDPRYPPNVSTVSFLKSNGETISPVGFEDHDGDKFKGPRGVWEGNLRDKLNTAKDWLVKFPTENGHGWIPQHNSCGIEGGEIIFWEDPKPHPSDKQENVNTRCIGTYIVNGGKESAVIQFNPSIKSNFLSLGIAGGQQGGRTIDGGLKDTQGKNPGVKRSKTFKRENKPYKQAGSEMSAAADRNLNDRHPDEAEKRASEAQAEQLRAMKLNFEPIKADLVVIGKPDVRPKNSVYNKTISIVFINPFHLLPSDGGECGDWTVKPDVRNEILTNRSWEIEAVTHKIEDGNYTTTFSLFLPMPGTDLDIDNTLGGDPCAWQPPPCP